MKFNLKALIDSQFKIQNSGLFLFLVLTIYLVVAYNSVGYHQEDEHYQIVEFANYKMGWITSEKLAWEFKDQIRPGFQPFICFQIFKVCSILGIKDGYNLVLILRMISALFAIIVIKQFVDSCNFDIDKRLQPYFVFLSYLLWFLPYINVRFSSENWSGLLFLLTLTMLQIDKRKGGVKRYFLMGVLLGISILFRYQSALFAFGMGLWFLFIENAKVKRIVIFSAAILLVQLIGAIFDRWLYGTFSFTFYRYFYDNVIKGVASHYGTAPWYEILRYILKSPGPFGIFLILSFFTILFSNAKHIMLWTIIPFLIAHSIIPHKELRFLFPIANLAPLFLILSFQFLKNILNYRIKYLIIFIVSALFFLNFAGLLAVATTGASYQTAVTNFIDQHYKKNSLNIILTKGLNPYMDWQPPYNTFYSSTGIRLQFINTFWQSNFLKYEQPHFTNLLIIPGDDYTGIKTEELFKKYRLVKVYQNIPNFVMPIYDWYDSSLNNSVLMVYEFR